MELMVFPRRVFYYFGWGQGVMVLRTCVAVDWRRANTDQPSLLNWSSGKEINKPRISKVGLLKAKKARLKRIIHFYESSSGKLILHV